MPKMLPNRTFTLALPLLPLPMGGVEGQEQRTQPEHPGEERPDRHIVEPPRTAEPPSATPATVAAKSPTRGSIPTASAAIAPV